MKWSNAFIPTSKENPKEAETISHRLLQRGGFITQHQSGVYTFLPLGWKVMLKIQQIIREEMNAIGAQELLMPALTSGDVWKASGRWESFGKDMFKFQDRKGKDIALAPTHEEIISLLAKDYIKSYRDLPQIWYQLQTKFRDEPRPRGGILRVREFIMKDSYSFDRDFEGLLNSYLLHREAYSKIFSRCGLPFVIVEASSGLMGGKKSEEFMVVADSGEDSVVICPKCGYYANTEVARGKILDKKIKGNFSDKKEVHTPNVRTVDEVSEFLNVSPELIVKSILFVSNNEDESVLVLIRGDYEINEAKLSTILGSNYHLASFDYIKENYGVEPGFLGPIGLNINRILADESIKGLENFVVGANKQDYHIVGVNLHEIPVHDFVDIRVTKEGEICERCGTPLEVKNAIEVGHIFQLGTRYSDSLDVKYTDADGQLKPIVMGSYGIGVGRIMAAAVEVFHDEKGIKWPFSIAPYHVNIIEINPAKTSSISENVYNSLMCNGLEVLWDERNISAGVKFKDAELIGIPFNVVVSETKVQQNLVELQIRKTGEKIEVNKKDVAEKIKKISGELNI